MKVSIIWGPTSDQILEAFRFISSALVLCRSRDERLKCCFYCSGPFGRFRWQIGTDTKAESEWPLNSYERYVKIAILTTQILETTWWLFCAWRGRQLLHLERCRRTVKELSHNFAMEAIAMFYSKLVHLFQLNYFIWVHYLWRMYHFWQRSREVSVACQ